MGFETIALDLLLQQVLLGNIEFFILGVTRQADHFHPIQQGTRNVHRVGSRHKHHIGEVIIDFQIVIVKAVVLLRIQDLQQRRGRVATHIRRHLVDLIQQEQRIAHPHLGHLLQQLAGHGADVGATVTADLGLIAHAA